MNKIIIIALALLSSNLLFGQFSVVLISKSDSSIVYDCVNELMKNKQFKNVNFRIVHYNEIANCILKKL